VASKHKYFLSRGHSFDNTSIVHEGLLFKYQSELLYIHAWVCIIQHTYFKVLKTDLTVYAIEAAVTF